MEQLESLAREAMANLAAGIGVSADFIWPIMVRQAYVHGWYCSLVTVSSAVLLILCLRGVLHQIDMTTRYDGECCSGRADHNETKDEKRIREGKQNRAIAKLVASGIGFIFGSGMVIACMRDAFHYVLNPKYYALEKVVEMIAQVKP